VTGDIKNLQVEKKKSARGKELDYIPVTPSKRRPGSPLKKTIRFSPVSVGSDDSEEEGVEEDEEKQIDDPDKIFYCRLAVDSRRGIFYDFKWERHRRDALARSKILIDEPGPSSKQDESNSWGQGQSWDVVEEKRTKHSSATKKVKKEPGRPDEISESEADDSDDFEGGSESDSDVDMDEEDDQSGSDGVGDSDELDTLEPRTPSKKRRRGDGTSPRKHKRNKTLVHPTPHSKAALARRQKGTSSSPRKRKSTVNFPIRFPEQSLTFQASMAHLPKDPWLRSMHALHVGSRPDALPCREEEYEKVLRCVGELLEEGSGGCVCKSALLLSIDSHTNIVLWCRHLGGAWDRKDGNRP